MNFSEDMFLDNWTSLFDILVKGVIIYIFLIFFNRLSGKRSLGQMNSFDFVINVAMGSVVGTVMLSATNAIAEGAAAIFLLIFLQLIITWGGVHSPVFNQFIKSEPKILFYHNMFIKKAMKKERITESDLFHAIRNHGISDLNQVEAVVLETNGDLSVIKKAEKVVSSTLQNINFDPVDQEKRKQ